VTSEAEPETDLETYYAGAYWGPRKESPEECARRLELLLAALPHVDLSFTNWFIQAKSLEESLKRPLELTHAALTQWIKRGTMRSDGGKAMEDLGYSLGAWNGERNAYDASSVLIGCGRYHERGANRCLFHLPRRGPNAERVLTAPVLSGLVRSMALAWEPDRAVAMSHAHRDMVDKAGKTDVLLGWVTYLSRRRGTVPPLPAPVRIEPVEDKGTLIVLTSERFTASNPEHVELARRVRELLVKAGLMQPVTRYPSAL